jgi:hypothetical protein
MQCKRDTPNHAAEELAADQLGVDDPPGRECADHAGDANLTEVRIDFDLRKGRAVAMHGVFGLSSLIGGSGSCGVQLGEAGTAKISA